MRLPASTEETQDTSLVDNRASTPWMQKERPAMIVPPDASLNLADFADQQSSKLWSVSTEMPLAWGALPHSLSPGLRKPLRHSNFAIALFSSTRWRIETLATSPVFDSNLLGRSDHLRRPNTRALRLSAVQRRLQQVAGMTPDSNGGVIADGGMGASSWERRPLRTRAALRFSPLPSSDWSANLPVLVHVGKLPPAHPPEGPKIAGTKWSCKAAKELKSAGRCRVAGSS